MARGMMSICLVVSMLMAGQSFAADQITLSNGDVLKGKIVEKNDSQIVLEHPVLGRVTAATANVTAVVFEAPPAPAADTPQPVADGAPLPPPEWKDGTWFDQFRKDWKSHLDFGTTATRGNTHTTNLYVAFTTKRETDTDRDIVDLSYSYATNKGVATESRFTAGIHHDWLFQDSPWSIFAEGRYDFDDFASYDHRVRGAAGVGYDAFKTEDMRLTLRAGAGALKEFGSNNDKVRPEGLLGVEYAWTISERQSLNAAFTYYPNFDNITEYRAVATLDWRLKIDQMDGLSVKVGIKDEYNSLIDPGKYHNDLQIITALGLDF